MFYTFKKYGNVRIIGFVSVSVWMFEDVDTEPPCIEGFLNNG